MNILFYDPSTPTAYTDQTLGQQALRGTESTIIRIAHGLKKHCTAIYVAQHCRSSEQQVVSDGVHYISFAAAHRLAVEVVILLRDTSLLKKVAQQFPQAKLFFWMHNLPPRDLYQHRTTLSAYGYQIIAVSQFHRGTIEKRLTVPWYRKLFQNDYMQQAIPVHVIYNPIADDLCPNQSPYRREQMIFTSSAYKGLDQCVAAFEAVREVYPEYELLVISPDAFNMNLAPRIRQLAPMPFHQLIQHIRESFCVFYPQTKRIETFGLIYAEANAVGTPVLAHDFGAASEVLSDASQLVQGDAHQAIIKKIAQWRVQRPKVQAKAEFRLAAVLQRWLQLLIS